MNKAKGRQSQKKSNYYAAQFAVTEKNKRRRAAKRAAKRARK